MAMTDTHMEELVEHARTIAAEGGSARMEGSYHGEALLAPEADFLTDDRSSANSNMEVADRLTYLEQRMQMQEDEIQLLKMALADVLKRLNISEEQTAALSRRTPGKGARPVSLALPPRPSSSGGSSSLKKSTTLPPASALKNCSPSSTRKRSDAGSVKDSPGVSAGRTRTTTTSCKKLFESAKPKESTSNVVGMRRVTHCKVTMQIYLSPLSRKTGSSEAAITTATQPSAYPPAKGPPQAKGASDKTKPSSRKSPTFTLALQKGSCQTSFTPLEAPSYRSPIKSPSQYFQICY